MKSFDQWWKEYSKKYYWSNTSSYVISEARSAAEAAWEEAESQANYAADISHGLES